MPATLMLMIFPVLMAFAAASDLLTMRISNRLVAVLGLAFFPIALIAGLPLAAFGPHLAAGALVLAVAFGFFAMNWIGGGDAKLAAVTGLWLGLPLLMEYLIYSALLGGALTLAILFARRLPLPAPLASVGWVDRLHDTQTGIPYGIALAAGGLLVYPQTAIFLHFAV